jgi:hypothetical protein
MRTALATLLLASLLPTGAARADGSPKRPRVLLLPTLTVNKGAEAEALEEDGVQVFWGAFYAAATARFELRRFEVVSLDELKAALKAAGQLDRCPTAACVSRLVRETGATAWVSGVLVRAGPTLCRSRVTVYDLERQRVELAREDDIQPCSSSELAHQGAVLGHRAAEGARWRPQATLSLTPLAVPSLEIPRLTIIDAPKTSTPSRSMTALERQAALERYRQESVRLISDNEGRSFLVHQGTVVGDCELLALAHRPIPPATQVACSGNWWELGWLSVPIGGLFLIPTGTNLIEGDNPLPFVFAMAVTLAGPVLALALNIDAPALATGVHVLPLEEIEEIIAELDTALLASLGLSPADVGP